MFTGDCTKAARPRLDTWYEKAKTSHRRGEERVSRRRR
jgi:hypothetical protein